MQSFHYSRVQFFFFWCKVVDSNLSCGLIKAKQLSHISGLASAYDVAWRKHDFAR